MNPKDKAIAEMKRRPWQELPTRTEAFSAGWDACLDALAKAAVRFGEDDTNAGCEEE